VVDEQVQSSTVVVGVTGAASERAARFASRRVRARRDAGRRLRRARGRPFAVQTAEENEQAASHKQRETEDRRRLVDPLVETLQRVRGV
jgi:hypothetical protein